MNGLQSGRFIMIRLNKEFLNEISETELELYLKMELSYFKDDFSYVDIDHDRNNILLLPTSDELSVKINDLKTIKEKVLQLNVN